MRFDPLPTAQQRPNGGWLSRVSFEQELAQKEQNRCGPLQAGLFIMALKCLSLQQESAWVR